MVFRSLHNPFFGYIRREASDMRAPADPESFFALMFFKISIYAAERFLFFQTPVFGLEAESSRRPQLFRARNAAYAAAVG